MIIKLYSCINIQVQSLFQWNILFLARVVFYFLSQILDFRGAKHDWAAACYHIEVIAISEPEIAYTLYHILFTQFVCVVLNGSKKFTRRRDVYTNQKTTMTLARLKIAAAAAALHDIIGPTLFPFSVYIYNIYRLWYIIYTVYTPDEGEFYFGAKLR